MSGKTSIREAWQRKVWRPLITLFRQGLSPRKMALCIVLGALISVFPVLGTTTILCTVAAAVFRLNLPAIQAVNWLLAGIQLVLIIPFMRLGEKAFGSTPLPLAPAELLARYQAGPWAFAGEFGMSILHAVSGWAIAAVPAALGAYGVMVLILRSRVGARTAKLQQRVCPP